jgi:hypothetical protein
MTKLELLKQNLASEQMDVLTGSASLMIKGGHHKKSGKKSGKKSRKRSSKYNTPICGCPPPPSSLPTGVVYICSIAYSR